MYLDESKTVLSCTFCVHILILVAMVYLRQTPLSYDHFSLNVYSFIIEINHLDYNKNWLFGLISGFEYEFANVIVESMHWKTEEKNAVQWPICTMRSDCLFINVISHSISTNQNAFRVRDIVKGYRVHRGISSRKHSFFILFSVYGKTKKKNKKLNALFVRTSKRIHNKYLHSNFKLNDWLITSEESDQIRSEKMHSRHFALPLLSRLKVKSLI